MASSVTLPGGSGSKFVLPVGADASAALSKAIKGEFTAAGKNITMNVVKNGAAGKVGHFNSVISQLTANTKLTAGPGVQAIVDLGSGKDTLIGTASTHLIYGNVNATKGDAITVTGKTSVFGTNGADTLTVTNGNATAYLEGGNNSVILKGTSDTISLPGTGVDSVSVTAGTKASIVGGAGALTVKLSSGAATIHGGSGKTTIVGGSGNVSVVGGTGALNFAHGKGGNDTVVITKNSGTDTLVGAKGVAGGDVFNIGVNAGGKYLINSFSSTTDKIKIAGATNAQIAAALKGQHTTTKGGVTTTTLTVGQDKITVVGGALTVKNFTH
jgi:hypothetical protein